MRQREGFTHRKMLRSGWQREKKSQVLKYDFYKKRHPPADKRVFAGEYNLKQVVDIAEIYCDIKNSFSLCQPPF